MNESSRRYLYIDETGTPYLNDSRSNFFILIGVSISGFSNAHSIYYLDDIFRKYGIDYRQHFHAVDLFQKIQGKDGNYHSMYIQESAKARSFNIEIANFINTFPVYIQAAVIKKRSFMHSLGFSKSMVKNAKISQYDKNEINFMPYTYSVTKLAHEFATHNKKGDDGRAHERLGSIILESRFEDPMILDALRSAENPDNYSDGKVSQKALNVKENIASIQFANKYSCYPGLALADIIGFSLHQRYANKVKKFKSRGIPELLKVIDKNSSIATNQSNIMRDAKKRTTKEMLNKISKI